MGVSGSGKTTVGRLVAEKLGWRYLEADDFHPKANKAKMGAGVALTDEDRAPWLDAIREAMAAYRARDESAVVSCSALKETYRARLLRGFADDEVLLVFLCGDADTLRSRLHSRAGHFMKAEMLQSQLDALEPPEDALTLDITQTPEALAATIVSRLDHS